ncbi:glycosyltransferase family 39 protein [Roseimicrobium sp. ORNL1]|uniref:glycosyltransferase family 39 protein n=1 Tax=Roseimicrobium sp. ORNL1 TaxID=2711231 RepID=UPI0013E1D66D|nr:glycosyltransferase family 39 protein [Roseimicrobium sp. ORNL1]QIF04107.1 phosphatase PAP2 family protein [Roseimicrobium sp. ORNL1]
MVPLQALDTTLFRSINQGLANPVFDSAIPYASGNALFYPVLLAAAVFVIWRWQRRGWAFVLLAILAALVASNCVCGPLKDLIGRPRPFVTMTDVRLLAGNGSGSHAMPSCHAANWGALVVVTWMFWRRTWRFMVPLALLVGFSRVYTGVHYPSDVLAGFLLGGVSTWVLIRALEWLWQMLGHITFPALWARCPSLYRDVPARPELLTPEASHVSWRNAAWVLMIGLLIERLIYIASGTIELSEDEAYQWMWSQRLDWAYYSKPPLIAWLQWLGTNLWGDTAFGVRFMSPVLALMCNMLVWCFVRKRTDERTAFWVVAAFAVTPLFAVGGVLLTVDAPTVLFYTAAAMAMWKAMEQDSTKWWALAGVTAALGFLSKFFSPFLWAGLFLFLAFNRTYRHQLRRPGPWLALAMNIAAAFPVLYWNITHDWVTVTHLKERGGLDGSSHLNFATLGEFAVSVTGLLNPVFFLAAAFAVWGWCRMKEKPALLSFLVCMSAPVFLVYLALSVQAKAQPNWIAPAAPMLFLAAATWWHLRAKNGARLPARWLAAGFVIGLPAVIFIHDTDLMKKAVRIDLKPGADPLSRVRGGSDLARVMEEQRLKLETQTGVPTFLLADHYGRASLMNFYNPTAREMLPANQLSFVLSADKPQNQYWFWPTYTSRIGENAIFVRQGAVEKGAPKRLRQEFEKVESLGIFKIRHEGAVCQQVQIFACRCLRPLPGTSPVQAAAGTLQASVHTDADASSAAATPAP